MTLYPMATANKGQPHVVTTPSGWACGHESVHVSVFRLPAKLLSSSAAAACTRGAPKSHDVQRSGFPLCSACLDAREYAEPRTGNRSRALRTRTLHTAAAPLCCARDGCTVRDALRPGAAFFRSSSYPTHCKVSPLTAFFHESGNTSIRR